MMDIRNLSLCIDKERACRVDITECGGCVMVFPDGNGMTWLLTTRYPEAKDCQQPVNKLSATECVWLQRGRCEGWGSVVMAVLFFFSR